MDRSEVPTQANPPTGLREVRQEDLEVGKSQYVSLPSGNWTQGYVASAKRQNPDVDPRQRFPDLEDDIDIYYAYDPEEYRGRMILRVDYTHNLWGSMGWRKRPGVSAAMGKPGFYNPEITKFQVRADLPSTVVLQKGQSKSDADLFQQMFEEPTEWSFCPICLAQVRRESGCTFMHHKCEAEYRHEGLYEKFGRESMRAGQDGNIQWCTLCGRITLQHKHYKHSSATSSQVPQFEAIELGVSENDRQNGTDCKRLGGGGFEEKVRRTHQLLNKACELQSQVGKARSRDVRTELIEAVWNAADAENPAAARIIANKKFEFPCTFPHDTALDAPPTTDAPDIARPADQKELTPVKHVDPDNECVVELGPHEDGRPTQEFRHKQPDGSIVNHPLICAEHLEQAIRSQPITGKCPIEPDKCTALLYPEELQGISTPTFQETQRKLFNKANQSGGGTSSLMQMANAMCDVPKPKKKAGKRRKTRRVRKGRRKTVKAKFNA